MYHYINQTTFEQYNYNKKKFHKNQFEPRPGLKDTRDLSLKGYN